MTDAVYELKVWAEGEARDANGRLLDADGQLVEPDATEEDNEEPQEAS